VEDEEREKHAYRPGKQLFYWRGNFL
jgi:hypothetical protein